MKASRALVTIEQRDGTRVTCRTRIAGKVARCGSCSKRLSFVYCNLSNHIRQLGMGMCQATSQGVPRLHENGYFLPRHAVSGCGFENFD
jgi:hypothetical protein